MLELRREPSDGAASRALFAEYMGLIAERLGPGFQPSEAIFATEEAFREPRSAWLVGYEDGRPVCCGGLRPAGPDVAEIKRMFVSSAARRRGHGRRLLGALETLAAEAGFRSVRLLTTEALVEARALYESTGYRVVETYRDGERADFWLEKALDAGRRRAAFGLQGRQRGDVMEREPSHNPAADIEPEDATPSGDADTDSVPAPFDTPDEDPTPIEERAKEAERRSPSD